MKKILSIIALLSMVSLGYTQDDGIHFYKGSWEEALEEAAKEDKIIFVDAYAVWCGPCKRMAKTVFTNSEVGSFYNQHFINMKIDMEKGFGLDFRKKYPVSAFPTLYYIDGSGEVVYQTKGARQKDQFIELGKMVLGKANLAIQENYEKAYNEGNRDPELVYNYVKYLNAAGKSSLKVANDYINSQSDLSSEQNRLFILEAASECDSRIFKMLIENREAIEEVASPEKVNDQIEKACKNTLNKAIEFQSDMLLEEAKNKMSAHHASGGKNFAIEADMQYHKALRNPTEYYSAAKKYVSKIAKGNAKDLNNVASDILKVFPDDKKLVDFGEKTAEKAVKNGGLREYYMTYVYLLIQNGKEDEAKKVAKEGKVRFEEDKNAQRQFEIIIKKIEE